MAIEEVGRICLWKELGNVVLTIEQEFSIEIPDKEADQIHSGRLRRLVHRSCIRY